MKPTGQMMLDLLVLYQKLLSEKDGISRPTPQQIVVAQDEELSAWRDQPLKHAGKGDHT